MMKNNLEMMEVNLEIKEDGLQMMEDGMDMMEDNMDTMEDNMGAVDHEKNVFCKNWGERLSKSYGYPKFSVGANVILGERTVIVDNETLLGYSSEFNQYLVLGFVPCIWRV